MQLISPPSLVMYPLPVVIPGWSNRQNGLSFSLCFTFRWNTNRMYMLTGTKCDSNYQFSYRINPFTYYVQRPSSSSFSLRVSRVSDILFLLHWKDTVHFDISKTNRNLSWNLTRGSLITKPPLVEAHSVCILINGTFCFHCSLEEFVVLKSVAQSICFFTDTSYFSLFSWRRHHFWYRRSHNTNIFILCYACFHIRQTQSSKCALWEHQSYLRIKMEIEMELILWGVLVSGLTEFARLLHNEQQMSIWWIYFPISQRILITFTKRRIFR